MQGKETVFYTLESGAGNLTSSAIKWAVAMQARKIFFVTVWVLCCSVLYWSNCEIVFDKFVSYEKPFAGK